MKSSLAGMRLVAEMVNDRLTIYFVSCHGRALLATETLSYYTSTSEVINRLKPRPHQQQRRSNIDECYNSNDSLDKVKSCFDKIERCFDIIAVFWQQCQTKFRPFDKVETN